MLSEVRFDHMRLLRSEAQNWGGEAGASQNDLAPPLANPAPPKLLGAIFEKKSGGSRPPDPQKLALRAPPPEYFLFCATVGEGESWGTWWEKNWTFFSQTLEQEAAE